MTRPADVRLVLSDVDGTLVTRDKVLTARAAEAVRSLKTAGVGFSVTSSRPPKGMAMLTGPLALALPIAGCNGGAIVRPDMSVLSLRLIRKDLGEAVGELMASLDLDVWIYTTQDWFVPDKAASHVERETFILQFPPKILADWRTGPLDEAIKIVGVSDDFDQVAEAEAAARERFGDEVSAARSARHFLDVTHPEATKGAVVRTLAAELGLDPMQVATIGDMPNDVLMFQQSGWSIAMGNASEAVKAAADAVTASNEEDGFAKAIEDLLKARRGADDGRS